MPGEAGMVQIEKTRLNAWNVGAVVVSLCVNAFGLGVVYTKFDSKLTDMDNYRVARSAQTDANFATINQKLAPFDTTQFRLTSLETTVKLNNDNLNSRMDRVVDSLGQKMDGLGSKIDTQGDAVNALRTDVKVLTQKVDAGNSDKRAGLNSLPSELAIIK